MKPSYSLSLIVGFLCAHPKHRGTQATQVIVVIAEGTRLRRAPFGSWNHIPILQRSHTRRAGPGVGIDNKKPILQVSQVDRDTIGGDQIRVGMREPTSDAAWKSAISLVMLLLPCCGEGQRTRL